MIRPIGSASGGDNPGNIKVQVKYWTHGERINPPPDVGIIRVGSAGDSIQVLWGGEITTESVTVEGYVKLPSTIFYRGPILVILGMFLSSSSSTGTITSTCEDDGAASLGVAQS